MSLASLSEYLVLLVCLELPVVDIYSLRQACRSLCKRQERNLVDSCVERQIHQEGKVLPPYMKSFDLLDSGVLEALACRVARLDGNWETGVLSPVRDWRLYLPQSITWLRLVAGTWLFVASSDNHTSKISCWHLSSVFLGSKDPVAEAYLPGQVKTGKLEVQDSGIVLALGLGAESPAVHIILCESIRERMCSLNCAASRALLMC
ncbi:hypothetical protein B0H13DRAFT_964871 [Mycena leptocephala]|nr:hypothetical protein B0H13DRAFT_964871 [Mycena leptocephala]